MDPFVPRHHVSISGLRLLRDPDTLRKHVERLTIEERRALRAPEREIAAYKERLASLGRKRSGFEPGEDLIFSYVDKVVVERR